jgi:hypothetical protein
VRGKVVDPEKGKMKGASTQPSRGTQK